MALDANLFARMGAQPRSMGDYRQELDTQEANALALKANSLNYQNALQAQQDDQAYRDAAKGFTGDAVADVNMLRSRGLAKQATAYEKQVLDAQKTKADINQSNASAENSRASAAKSQIESYQTKLGLGMKILQTATTPQAAAQLVTQAVQSGQMDPAEGQRYLSEVPQDPNSFGQWRQGQLIEGMDVGKRLEQQRLQAEQAERIRHNKATEENTRRGQNLTNARAIEANAQGRVPSGYRQNQDGTLSFIPGGPADPAAAKRAAPTEDERKAAGWLAQARNGFKNMEQAIADDPSASKPGIIESLPFVVEGIKNTTRSEARQRFNQGASSFAEAALRAATGAGVNKDEAQQKIAELTPQWGDKPEVIQQKREGLEVYLQSLEARAGRAGTPDPDQTPKPVAGAFADADKERRYQEWKARQGK